VKLVDYSDGRTIMSAFVCGGQRLITQAPIGSYELRYATGTDWFGEAHLFGPSTACMRSSQPLTFTSSATGYAGHSVTLIKQPNGNFATSSLDASSF
jgi:hypothetical protein